MGLGGTGLQSAASQVTFPDLGVLVTTLPDDREGEDNHITNCPAFLMNIKEKLLQLSHEELATSA